MKRYEEALLTGFAFLFSGAVGLAGINHSVYQKLGVADDQAGTHAVSQQIEVVEPIVDPISQMEDSGRTEEVLVTEYRHFLIPYQTVTYDVGSMEGGELQEDIPGVNGERIEEYQITFVNGQETGRILSRSWVEKEPVTAVQYIDR